MSNTNKASKRGEDRGGQGSAIPFRRGNNESPLWATERKMMNTGEWSIQIWLNTKDHGLSHSIHQDVATLVRARMEEAARTPDTTKPKGLWINEISDEFYQQLSVKDRPEFQ